MAEIGSLIDDRYRLIRYISKGGTSKVYLAENIRLGNLWAVKEICKTGEHNNELFINGLKSEAEMMKNLDYPAFPRIVDIIEDSEALYLVMDYIEGRTLQDVLSQEGPQSEETVREWAIQLCEALSYLHGQQPPIIYRDMKPSNVILKNDGSLKIIDFGTARVFNPDKANDTIALGTGGFAPPEQYHGRTDARSDIYALGVTIKYLITGITPWDNSTPQENGRMSPNMAAVISRCTAFYPEQRFRSCQELAYALQNLYLSTDHPVRKAQTVQPAVRYIPSKPAKRSNPWPVVIMVLSILAFLVGMGIIVQNRTEKTTTSSASTVPYSSVADFADLITTEEEARLAQMLDRSYSHDHFVTAVVTTNSLGGKDIKDYSIDYYENHLSGFSDNSDGIMLLIGVEDKKMYITTTGSAITKFPDDSLNEIFDAMESDIANGDYGRAFETFARYTEIK